MLFTGEEMCWRDVPVGTVFFKKVKEVMEINKKISLKAREVNMELRWKEGEDYSNGIG